VAASAALSELLSDNRASGPNPPERRNFRTNVRNVGSAAATCGVAARHNQAHADVDRTGQVITVAGPSSRKETTVATKVRPLSDRVLLRRSESETKTKGGIIIPDTAKEKPQQGVVVAVGPGFVREDGSRREPLVKAGDRVMFGRYDGTEVNIDGEPHLIVREKDLLGVLD
jgi:chaperonin GroES